MGSLPALVSSDRLSAFKLDTRLQIPLGCVVFGSVRAGCGIYGGGAILTVADAKRCIGAPVDEYSSGGRVAGAIDD